MKAESHVASVNEFLKELVFVLYQLNKLISAVLWRLQVREFLFSGSITL